ncbi:restriction endonuclease subunit S [Vibrio parahaemolyticus]|uniref:restriction endonuclease subunit S n=1 Tax=Vibrio parahaemolyticus TaxID=670 RepID=UPI000A37A131|nr:restriction endonuclease subunit S [Vibrio parahaemolyticus]OUJ51996.1 restriction endonuclease subunit S [Vibrio parahaemolyticus]TOA31567.1 restriction endonuclease subunit S [Vibrio parahaemolyticus]
MAVENLITEHIDIWTSAVKTKSTSGRGSSKKLELYGIKKLRELILELAVRGKLVPQDSNDEPASALLERIAGEKAQLVKEKKIKKPKKLEPISTEDYLFDIPSSWSWERLGNIGETNIGLTYSPKEAGDEGIPVLRSANIQKGKIDLSDLVRVQKEVKDSVLVEIGDLLICARNGSKALVGKTAQIKALNEPMAFGAFMAIFRSCINDYIEVFLNSPVYRRNLDGVSTTTINQVTQTNLRSTICPLPPVNEQHRIVAKVDELMTLCDQLEQQTEASIEAHQVLVTTLLDTLTNSADADELMQNWARISEHFDTLFTTEESIDQLKQTILQLAVMGKLVPQDPSDEPAAELLKRIAEEKAQLVKDKKIKKQKALPPISEDEKPFEVPSGWEWERLGNYSYVFAGNAFKSGDFNNEAGTKVIKITNAGVYSFIETNDFLPSEFSEAYYQYQVLEGDLILALTRPYISSGLKVSVCPSNYNKSLLNQRVAAIRTLDSTGFTFLFLQSPVVLSHYQQRFGGSGLQPNLKMSDVTDLFMAVPPKNEQLHIVRKVHELFALCDQLRLRLRGSQKTQLELTNTIVEQAVES